ncbi:MAG: peptidylprolyl isomerase [Planctomycetota bacterium]|jgi:cyclophilin family peptidyl-prolyl cis-trans isomerase
MTRSSTIVLNVLAALVLTGAAHAQAEAQPPKKPAKTTAAAAPPVYISMMTSKGEMVLELNAEKAPVTVANFVAYAKKGYYNDTIFHRVIGNFMIQGGGFTTEMKKKPTADPIKNEWRNGLKNERGSIAMARLGGQADSATSQFFINVVNNAGLDQPRDGAGYAVFGKVIGGMDVVDAIKAVSTTNVGPYRDVPAVPVVIEKVSVITAEQATKRSKPAE